jgi:hypothetical protein
MDTVIITIMGPNLPVAATEPQFHAHASDCADLKNGLYRGQEPWTIDVTCRKEATLDLYPPEQFEYNATAWREYASDIRWFPCLNKLPAEDDSGQ